MRLELVRASRGRVVITARGSDGSMVARASSAFLSAVDFVRAAEELGISEETLASAVDNFERTGTSAHENGEHQLVTFTVRDIAASSTSIIVSSPDPVMSLLQLSQKQYDFIDPAISWDRGDLMSAVDLDATDWTIQKLSALLIDLRPTPGLAWVTRSGGLRLIYGSSQRFSGEELAAVACLHLSATQTYGSLELKSDTRLPASEVLKREQDTDSASLRRWLRQYQFDDQEVADWLEERGLEVGKRYDHDACPISPSSHGSRQPVVVGEHGIHCYVCEARGETRGSSRPGFLPYASVVGGYTATTLYFCLENMAHWEHVKRVMLPMFKIGGKIAELSYRAALKMHHQEASNAVIDRIMLSGDNLVRMDGRWTTCDGQSYTKDLPSILSQLPAACLHQKGKLAISRSKLAVLQQTFDLTKYGYPSLTPVHGIFVYGQHLEYDDSNIRIIVQSSELAQVQMERFRPKYERIDRRLDLEEAWLEIERVFPGINRNLVYLLIAARGIAEAAIGMPPMLFISGPTGASKSSTIQIAASMLGDGVSEVVWTNSVERVRQAIADGKEFGSFIAFNEIIKEIARYKQDASQVGEFILNLTPNSLSHKMYVGPVRLGSLPVFAWTDTHVPTEIKQYAQLARRLIHIHLPTQVDWKQSLAQSGVLQPIRIRVSSPWHARACDAIVGHVIDTQFVKRQTFEQIAFDLGFQTMAESQEAIEGEDILRSFFKAICDAPALVGTDAARNTGRGWKIVQRGQDSLLASIWEQIADPSWSSSSRCAEVDWIKLVGAKEPIRLEIRLQGTLKVLVRFRSIAGGKQDYRVNEELLCFRS